MKMPSEKNTPLQTCPIAILGIPVTNNELHLLVSSCLEMIKKNKVNGKSSYLSIINERIIEKCYGYLPATIENHDLLAILRNSSFSVNSEPFLIRLAHSLGSKTSPAYPFHDFILTLCYSLAEQENGIFLLGSNEQEIKATGLSLHDKFKKLRLVGIAAPFIFTEGEDLINAQARDALLIEQINSSHAEVLFLELDSSKQMVWLERVLQHLKIPLIITVEGSLSLLAKNHPEFLINSTKSKPNKTETKTTWAKISTFTKLTCLSIPLILFHTLNRYLYQWFYKNNHSGETSYSRLFISSNRTIAVITLPECLDTSNQSELKQILENTTNHDAIIIDFREVRHIQPEGFYFLIKTWMQRNRENKEIYAYAIPGDIEWLMKLHHTWDLFKNTFCESLDTLISRLSNHQQIHFYDSFSQNDNQVTIGILGSLNNGIDYNAYLKKIMPIIDQKNCCIDFTYCTSLENLGVSFLLNLRKHLHSQNHSLILKSIAPQLRKQLRAADVNKLFILKVDN